MLLRSPVLLEVFFYSFQVIQNQLKLAIFLNLDITIKIFCGIQKQEYRQDKKQKLEIM